MRADPVRAGSTRGAGIGVTGGRSSRGAALTAACRQRTIPFSSKEVRSHQARCPSRFGACVTESDCRGLPKPCRCVTLRAGQQRPAFSFIQMTRTTPLPNDKLTPWWLAVGWARTVLQQRIVQYEAQGWNAAYDMRQLEQLDDMEIFLKMSWDQWMDELDPKQTVQEVNK